MDGAYAWTVINRSMRLPRALNVESPMLRTWFPTAPSSLLQRHSPGWVVCLTWTYRNLLTETVSLTPSTFILQPPSPEKMTTLGL